MSRSGNRSIHNNYIQLLECLQAQGMENGAISDEQITASSQYTTDHAAYQGRLHLQETSNKSGSWVAGAGDANPWLQIDLRTLYTKVTRVATQGSNGVNHIDWVTIYKLQYGNDGVNVHYYRELGETADKVPREVTIPFTNQYSKVQIIFSLNLYHYSVSAILIYSYRFYLFLANIFNSDHVSP